MKTLQLGRDFAVPVDIATEALAWIGARGSGKTHGSGKLVELLTSAGVPVVVLDPVGVWYGLRLARDGKGRGLAIPVFGGLHGDIPLEPTGGALIADLIVDKDISAVVDVSQFDTDADKARFVSAFAQRLFQRKKKDPSVIHWVIDEAQEFVPQNPQPGEQMMLHHVQRVLKLGRNFGIGTSLLTQRPQETSKKALNQCQTVLAFRVTGPQERKAMKDWIAAHDLDQALVEKLPSLETGTCHVWSPAFLKVSQEVRILPKDTFDASATPKFGQRRATRELAPIDLEQLREAMKATVEKAKADDPKELRAQLTMLRKLYADAQAMQGAKELVEKRIEVPVLKEADVKRIEKALANSKEAMHLSTEAMLALSSAITAMRLAHPPAAKPQFVTTQPHDARSRSLAHAMSKAILKEHPTPAARQTRIAGEVQLGPSHRKVLNTLAWLAQLRVMEPSRAQVAVLSGMTPNGGYYARIVGELKTAGLISYPSGGALYLTIEGQAQADPGEAHQTNEAIQADVIRRLGPSHQRILQELISIHPDSASREHVATTARMDASGGYFARIVGELKTMGVVTYPAAGKLAAADILFVKGS